MRNDDSANTDLAALLQEINAVSIRLRQRGRPIDGVPGQVQGAEHAVLEIIDRAGSLTVPQIAKERTTSRQNIQILVDRLAANGRVQLANNPEHKRSALVQLTANGKALLEASTVNQQLLLEQLESLVSPLEVSTAISVLKRIQGLLSPEPEPQGQVEAIASPESSAQEPRAQNGSPQSDSTTNAAEEEFPVSLL